MFQCAIGKRVLAFIYQDHLSETNGTKENKRIGPTLLSRSYISFFSSLLWELGARLDSEVTPSEEPTGTSRYLYKSSGAFRNLLKSSLKKEKKQGRKPSHLEGETRKMSSKYLLT